MEGEGGDGELDGMQNLAVNDKEAKVTEEEKKEEKKVEEKEVEKGIDKGGAYQIIVADAADAVSVNFSGRCKFLLI